MGWKEAEKLHIAALDALSKHLHPDGRHAVMQGGTCLHLAYGSARYSEDLDFLTARDGAAPPSGPLAPWLEDVMSKVAKDVSGFAMAEFGRPVQLKSRSANAQGKNPVVYKLTMAGATKDKASTTVKCEFYCVSPEHLGSYKTRAKALRSAALPTVTPVLVVAEAQEILLDKLHALGVRGYAKYRDVFDLWWLAEAGDLAFDGNVQAQAANHLAMYGDSDFGDVLARAEDRLANADREAMRAELQRFVPPAMMSDESLAAMLAAAQGWISRIRAVLPAERPTPASTGPGPGV